MILILDACTFINLANGGVVGFVLDLPGIEFCLGSSVRKESLSVEKVLNDSVAAGEIRLVDDTNLSASRFAELKNRFRLGDGETECLLAAEVYGGVVACDDAAARSAVKKLLGKDRLTGSVGLLKLCVRNGFLSPSEAFSAFTEMKSRGGFLPNKSLRCFEITTIGDAPLTASETG